LVQIPAYVKITIQTKTFLKQMRKLSLLEAVAMLVGTTVGAGFLGIPYVVQKVGFPLGVVLILGICGVMLLQLLAVVEISLRTNGKHQIAGYVNKYLGKNWHAIIFTLVIMESYGALLAYIIGEGEVLSALFGGHALLFSAGFLLVAATLVFFDLKVIKYAELILTGGMVLAVLVVIFLSWPQVHLHNLGGFSFGGLLPAYGVILFAFLGVSAVPEMHMVLQGKEKLLSYAVIIGLAVPAVIYLLFTSVTLGVLGPAVTQVATVALGEKLGEGVLIIGNLLAATTMMTAFLALALALKETFWYDMKFSKNEAWLLTVLIPLILFLFGARSFIGTLLVVGAVFGGLQGIIIVFTWWKASRTGERKPEFVVPFPKSLGWLLITVFALGVIYTIGNW
jgi:tyrosine-specific transport protein